MLRFYLCGLSFAAYCFYMGRDRLLPVLCGSLVYIFTGWAFFFLRHPLFYAVLIYLPLLLIGVEEVLKKNRALFFSFMVFLSSWTHYYYLYINTIFVGIYFVARFLEKGEDRTWRGFFRRLWGLLWRYFLGIGLSMVVFLPNIVAFLNSDRHAPVIETGSLFRFGKDWFAKVILSLTATSTPGYYLYNGFAALGIISLIILFFRKKRYLSIKMFCVLVALFFTMPVFAFAFHGFSAVHFRWNYVIGMMAAFAAVVVLEGLDELSARDLVLPMLFTLGYSALQVWKNRLSSWSSMAGTMFLLASVVLLYLAVCFRGKPAVKTALQVALLCVVCANSYFSAKYLYDPDHKKYVTEFVDKGSSLGLITSSSAAAADQIGDDGFYRVDSANTAVQNENASLFLDTYGISSYVNVMDRRFAEYGYGLENLGTRLLDNVNNDNRTVLDTLASVKYFTAYDNEAAYVPYGYSLLKQTEVNGRVCNIYENDYALPLGYTYNRFISRSEYDALSSLEKQEALLSAAVVEDGSAAPEKLEKLEYSSHVIEEKNFTITGLDCAYDAEKKQLTVSRNGGYLTFDIPGMPNCETYIRLGGMDIDKYKEAYWTLTLFDDAGTLVKTFEARSDTATYTYNCYDYLINLGYSESGIQRVNLGFPLKSKFPLEDIQVFYQPMEDYGQEVERLGRESLQNIEQTVNGISGTVTVSGDKLLVLSIPYSTGWTAYVDGEKTQIECANVAFQGIMLSEGTHEVVLRYRTPGLTAGLAVTLACLLIFILVLIFWTRAVRRRVSAGAGPALRTGPGEEVNGV